MGALLRPVSLKNLFIDLKTPLPRNVLVKL